MIEPAEFITVYDAQGRPVRIPREAWTSEVLPTNLRREWDSPERLAALITSSLRDGLAGELREAALRLQVIDPDPNEAVVLRAVVELRADEPAEAERILREFLSTHPASGLVLTNLAKAQASLGRNQESEATLDEAMDLDPNQENGLDWLMAIHRERGGDAAVSPVLEGLSGRPGAWRPQLWLARSALSRGDIGEALALYRSVLPLVGPDGNGLMQVSGDLGRAGRPADAIELILPLYDPTKHGLPTGMNLLHALIELGRLNEADVLMARLEAVSSPPSAAIIAELDRQLREAHSKRTPGALTARLAALIRRRPR